eukprot:m.34054 g.34054  ORF g.34054 m.34054 type:complete len:544 (+) comp6494_c0_seq2:181-1812(+)
MMSKSGIILEGRMLKAPPIDSVEDATYKRWKRHKFILTDKALSYESKKKGHVDILVHHIVDVYPIPATKGREYLFGVTLSSSPRIFYFETDSDFSRTLWMEKIRSVSPQCTSTKRNMAYRQIYADRTLRIGVRIPIAVMGDPTEEAEIVFLPSGILIFKNEVDIPVEVFMINHIRSFGQSNKTIKFNLGNSHATGEGDRVYLLATDINLEPTFENVSATFQSSKQEYVESACLRSCFPDFETASLPQPMYTSIDHNTSTTSSTSLPLQPDNVSMVTHFVRLYGHTTDILEFVGADNPRITLTDVLDDSVIVTAPFFTAVSRFEKKFNVAFPQSRSIVGQFSGSYNRSKISSVIVPEAIYHSIDKPKITSYAALDLSADGIKLEETNRKSMLQETLAQDEKDVASGKKAPSSYVRVNFEATNALCDITQDTWAHKLGNLGNPNADEDNANICVKKSGRMLSSSAVVDESEDDTDSMMDRDSRSDSNASSVDNVSTTTETSHASPSMKSSTPKKTTPMEDGIIPANQSLDNDIDDLLALTDYTPQ